MGAQNLGSAASDHELSSHSLSGAHPAEDQLMTAAQNLPLKHVRVLCCAHCKSETIEKEHSNEGEPMSLDFKVFQEIKVENDALKA